MLAYAERSAAVALARLTGGAVPRPARAGAAASARVRPPAGSRPIGGCFVCFGRPERKRRTAGEPAWAAAAVELGRRTVASKVVSGEAGAYRPGLQPSREGPLLEAAVAALPCVPLVLLVNATGRDHPRRAGLALHLGALSGIPTVGVTHRPLLATGAWPPPQRGRAQPFGSRRRNCGCWLRTRERARPLAIHPGWGTNVETACCVVLAATRRVRAPEPLREQRRLAHVGHAHKSDER